MTAISRQSFVENSGKFGESTEAIGEIGDRAEEFRGENGGIFGGTSWVEGGQGVALIGKLTRAGSAAYRKPCLIIYQRRHRGCGSIPCHQFAAVPCSQHRHILIYPNVLHVASQFANRPNHPIALTLPAIQRPRSLGFYWPVPATGFAFANGTGHQRCRAPCRRGIRTRRLPLSTDLQAPLTPRNDPRSRVPRDFIRPEELPKNTPG